MLFFFTSLSIGEGKEKRDTAFENATISKSDSPSLEQICNQSVSKFGLAQLTKSEVIHSQVKDARKCEILQESS